MWHPVVVGSMRRILPILLVSFALLAAPVALADGDDTPHAGKGKSDDARAAAATHRANESEHDDDNESADDRGRKLDANRTAWRENHSAMIEGFVAQLKALQTSWHENATKVRESCKSATFDKENATRAERLARAHCIKDGYAAWRAEHRADIKELRDEMRALFESWHPKKHSR